MTADAPQRVSRAALLVGALLALPGQLPEARPDAACARPREAEASAGHSVAVRCDGGGGAPLRGPARLLFGQRLDPNRADRRSLEALPGIGPALAAAIERERCRRPFAATRDLERVHGIGPHTRARLEPLLAVTPGRARCDPPPGPPEASL